MVRTLLATDGDYGALLLRVTLGIVILPHGLQKLLGWFGGHGVAATVDSFQQYFGMPAVITYLVILAESVGAVFLIVGFLSRFAAVSIGLVMIGAIYTVTGRWGFFMNWYSEQGRGEGFEYHLLVLGMVAALVIKGSGKWSLDGFLIRNLGKSTP